MTTQRIGDNSPPTPEVKSTSADVNTPWLMDAALDDVCVEIPFGGGSNFSSMHFEEGYEIPSLNTVDHRKLLWLAVLLEMEDARGPLTQGLIVKKACNSRPSTKSEGYYNALAEMHKDKLLTLDQRQGFYRSNMRRKSQRNTSPHLDISQLGLQVATEEARRVLYGEGGTNYGKVTTRLAARVYRIGTHKLLTGRYKFLPAPTIL